MQHDARRELARRQAYPAQNPAPLPGTIPARRPLPAPVAAPRPAPSGFIPPTAAEIEQLVAQVDANLDAHAAAAPRVPRRPRPAPRGTPHQNSPRPDQKSRLQCRATDREGRAALRRRRTRRHARPAGTARRWRRPPNTARTTRLRIVGGTEWSAQQTPRKGNSHTMWASAHRDPRRRRRTRKPHDASAGDRPAEGNRSHRPKPSDSVPPPRHPPRYQVDALCARSLTLDAWRSCSEHQGTPGAQRQVLTQTIRPARIMKGSSA
jgi:hypothetical protein